MAISLHYRALGPSSVDATRHLLLLHGWMVDSRVFDRLLDALQLPEVRVLVPDLRGVGMSDKPESGYGLDDYAGDVVQLLVRENVDRVDLLGHSMGGQLAQWIAAHEPARVQSLTLASPVPARGLALPDDIAAAFAAAAGNRDGLAQILAAASPDLAAEDRDHLLASTVSPACHREALATWQRGGFEDQLDAITCPTTVIASADPFLPASLLQETVVDEIAGARLRVVEGAGHYIPVERPAEVAAIVAEQVDETR